MRGVFERMMLLALMMLFRKRGTASSIALLAAVPAPMSLVTNPLMGH